MIDQPRYAEWVQLSHRTAKFEIFMVPSVQGLGKLDATLVAEDIAYLQLADEQRLGIDLTDRFTISYLWVLGVYEIIRTISQRCREIPELAIPDEIEHIKESKRIFERIRIPLAKFEVPERFNETDSSIAYPSIHKDYGIAWQLAKNTFISRKELSDSFLNTLREIR